MDISDDTLEALEKNKGAIKAIQERINHKIEEILTNPQESKVDELIEYIENGQGNLAFRFVGESRRVLRVMHILQMEIKFGGNLICKGCINKDALMQKYKAILYACRRILFEFHGGMLAEAKECLLQLAPSPFAIYIMCNDDLICASNTFFETIKDEMKSVWNPKEIALFQMMIERK